MLGVDEVASMATSSGGGIESIQQFQRNPLPFSWQNTFQSVQKQDNSKSS
jgi:hypothetical protein